MGVLEVFLEFAVFLHCLTEFFLSLLQIQNFCRKPGFHSIALTVSARVGINLFVA